MSVKSYRTRLFIIYAVSLLAFMVVLACASGFLSFGIMRSAVKEFNTNEQSFALDSVYIIQNELKSKLAFYSKSKDFREKTARFSENPTPQNVDELYSYFRTLIYPDDNIDSMYYFNGGMYAAVSIPLSSTNIRYLQDGVWDEDSVRAAISNAQGAQRRVAADGIIIHKIRSGEFFACVLKIAHITRGNEAVTSAGSPARVSVLLALWLAAVYGVFLLGAWLASKKILSPLYEFNRILEGVSDFETETAINGYLLLYRKKSGLHANLFIYFSSSFLAVIIVIASFYAAYRPLIRENIMRGYYGLANQAKSNLNNTLATYTEFAKYLSLDADIQEASLDPVASDDTFARLLFDKGVLNRYMRYIAIWNPDGRIMFSSSPEYDTEPPDLKAMRAINGALIKKSSADGDNGIVIQSQIRYLPRSRSAQNLYKLLGTIEIHVDNAVFEKQKLLNYGVKLFSYLLDENGAPIIRTDNGAVGDDVIERLMTDAAYTSADEPFLTVDIGGETFLLLKSVAQENRHTTMTLIRLESIYKNELAVLAYFGLLAVVMLIIVFMLSEGLGNKMLGYITRMQLYMLSGCKNYTADESILSGETANEFTTLAETFRHLLNRLQIISKDNLELEKKRQRAYLVSLQAQIKPHFLHNIIASTVLLLKGSGNEKAAKMLAATGKLFRFGLFDSDEETTVLNELNHVESYLTLQKIRLEHTLEYKILCDTTLHGCKLPKFILQPIAENAIEHGKKNDGSVLRITVCVVRDDGALIITITDNGNGIPPERLDELNAGLARDVNLKHYGLTNVNTRMKLIYGESAGLSIANEPDGGVVVTYRLPV